MSFSHLCTTLRRRRQESWNSDAMPKTGADAWTQHGICGLGRSRLIAHLVVFRPIYQTWHTTTIFTAGYWAGGHCSDITTRKYRRNGKTSARKQPRRWQAFIWEGEYGGDWRRLPVRATLSIFLRGAALGCLVSKKGILLPHHCGCRLCNL